jgi:hypothetical protein
VVRGSRVMGDALSRHRLGAGDVGAGCPGLGWRRIDQEHWLKYTPEGKQLVVRQAP